jgi:hypothetical protein
MLHMLQRRNTLHRANRSVSVEAPVGDGPGAGNRWKEGAIGQCNAVDDMSAHMCVPCTYMRMHARTLVHTCACCDASLRTMLTALAYAFVLKYVPAAHSFAVFLRTVGALTHDGSARADEEAGLPELVLDAFVGTRDQEPDHHVDLSAPRRTVQGRIPAHELVGGGAEGRDCQQTSLKQSTSYH